MEDTDRFPEGIQPPSGSRGHHYNSNLVVTDTLSEGHYINLTPEHPERFAWWEQIGDDTFRYTQSEWYTANWTTESKERQPYCDLTLYAMGAIEASEVKPMLYLDLPYSPYSPLDGAIAKGSWISLDDL